jgi:uncharacterized coiled-coil protein SlyX
MERCIELLTRQLAQMDQRMLRLERQLADILRRLQAIERRTPGVFS